MLALRVARRGLSERWTVADILYGEHQLRWLQNRKTDDVLICWCRNMPDRLLKRDGLIISHTDNLPDDRLDQMLAALDPGKRESTVCIPMATDRPCAFSIAGDTGFSAWVAQLPENMRATGPLLVASRILSLGYLHREVREIGGAYGVYMRVAPNGLVECASYRDPHPFESLKKMNGTGAALRSFLKSGADIDRFVVATVSSMEPYRPPKDEAVLFADLYMDERTPEDEERIRQEILTTTKEQLLQFSELLDAVSSSATVCAVGGERQLRSSGDVLIQPIIFK